MRSAWHSLKSICLYIDTKCGCPKATEYADIVKPYKDRNIYELALKYKRQKEIGRQIDKLQKECDEIAKEIKNTGILD